MLSMSSMIKIILNTDNGLILTSQVEMWAPM